MRVPFLVALSFAAAAALAGCGGTSAATPSTTGGSAPPSTSPAAPSPSPSPAAAGTPTATPTGTTSGTSGPARCTSAGLEASLTGGEGAAGSVVRTLVLTNTGRATCTLQGFPGVSYVTGSAGTQVGAPAVRVGPPGAVVRLAPGRSAHALVSFANTGVFDPAECRPTAVRGLRVFPPGERAALFVPAPGTGCAGRPASPQLQVRSVAAA